MLPTLRSAVLHRPPARHTFINLYTTVASLTRTHWKTGAHPAPKPLGKDEEEEWPQPQVEALESGVDNADVDADADESTRSRSHRPFPQKPELAPTPSMYAAHRATMKKQFPEGWAPPRKVSREAMEKLRELHRLDPQMFSTPVLADRFRISSEAVRRILKSKWEPTRAEKARMAGRERESRLKWRLDRNAEEKRKYEGLREEYGIDLEERKDDRFSLI